MHDSIAHAAASEFQSMGARRRARWPTPCYFSAMITALSVVALVARVVSISLAGFVTRQAHHYDIDGES